MEGLGPPSTGLQVDCTFQLSAWLSSILTSLQNHLLPGGLPGHPVQAPPRFIFPVLTVHNQLLLSLIYGVDRVLSPSESSAPTGGGSLLCSRMYIFPDVLRKDMVGVEKRFAGCMEGGGSRVSTSLN